MTRGQLVFVVTQKSGLFKHEVVLWQECLSETTSFCSATLRNVLFVTWEVITDQHFEQLTSNLLTLWRQEKKKKKKKRGQIIRLGVLLEGSNNVQTPSTNHPHANWPVVLPLPIQPIGWSRPNHADGGGTAVHGGLTSSSWQVMVTIEKQEKSFRCLAHQVTHTPTPTHTHTHTHTHLTHVSAHTHAQARVHIHSLRYVCRSTHAAPSPLHPDIIKAKKKKEKRLLLVKLHHARGGK